MSAYAARVAIIATMAEQHVTVPQLAAKLGLLPEFTARLLGGRGPITPGQIREIAEVLDVDPDEFLHAGEFRCPECGSVGSAPAHRPDCKLRPMFSAQEQLDLALAAVEC